MINRRGKKPFVTSSEKSSAGDGSRMHSSNNFLSGKAKAMGRFDDIAASLVSESEARAAAAKTAKDAERNEAARQRMASRDLLNLLVLPILEEAKDAFEAKGVGLRIMAGPPVGQMTDPYIAAQVTASGKVGASHSATSSMVRFTASGDEIGIGRGGSSPDFHASATTIREAIENVLTECLAEYLKDVEKAARR